MDAKPSALLVDDEPDIRLTLQNVVREHLPEVDVHTAESGPDALDRMRHRTFDLVVSDYRMPGMDGLELLGAVDRRSPRTSRILMTAFADLDLAVRAVNESHVDFLLRKPLRPEAVVEAIARALTKSLDEQARDRVLAQQAAVGRDADLVLHTPGALATELESA